MSQQSNFASKMTANDRPDIFELHADLCKTLANPKRLMILALLGSREMSVGEIADFMGAPLSNVSQHLTRLKAQDVVKTRREGQTIYCRLADRRILKACALIRAVLLDGMKAHGQVAREIAPGYVIADLPD
jgi:ArsR family transcriptional regulator